jgi:hypothetical protein
MTLNHVGIFWTMQPFYAQYFQFTLQDISVIKKMFPFLYYFFNLYILVHAISFAEPHHFYAAPVPGKIFDAAPAPAAPVPTLLYGKAKFFK